MTQGDCLKVYQSLDTFSNLPDYLKNEDELAFVIELISRTSKEEWEAEKNKMILLDSLATQQTLGLLDEYQSGKLKDRLQETESGLKYIIHEKGEGPPVLRKKRLKTHYAGFLMDGTPFDSSFKKGQPFEMQAGVGGVIPAWDEGVALLQEGGKATLFIPAKLGYGEKGFSNLIPPNSDLVFYIEVVDVID
jgi:FKBP-type peptidyl-prolyl cis-trans isomerase FkpA